MLIVSKSGSLNLLEPLGPVQACNGIALRYMATRIYILNRMRSELTYNLAITLLGVCFTLFLSLFQAICTEAGLMALRERRMKVTNEDFRKSKESVLYRKKEGTPEGLYL